MPGYRNTPNHSLGSQCFATGDLTLSRSTVGGVPQNLTYRRTSNEVGPTRRAVIFGGLSIPLAAVFSQAPVLAASASPLPSPQLVAISEVGGNSDLIKLATLLDPFLIRMVPVIVTINPFDGEGKPLAHDSSLAKWMRSYLDRYPSHIEFGIHAPAIVSSDPYFQLRQISEAQDAFCVLANDFDHNHIKSLVAALTITTNSPLHSYQDCASLRAAGIRTVVRRATGAKDTVGLQPPLGGYWFTDTGLANAFASPLSATSVAGVAIRDAATLFSNIESLSKNSSPIVLDISFDVISEQIDAEIARYATEIAELAAQADASRSIRNVLPRTLYTQSRSSESRYVVVRIDDFRISRNADAAHTAFVRELVNLGYPLTDLVIPAPVGQLLTKDDTSIAYLKAMMASPRYDIAAHGWEHVAAELKGIPAESDFKVIRAGIREVYQSTGYIPTSYVPPNDAFDTNTLDGLAATGTAIFSAERGDYQWIGGLDQRGLLHVSNTIMLEQGWDEGMPYYEKDQVLQFFGTDNDAVFSIHPQTADTPEKRQTILDTLSTLSNQRGTKLVNFSEYFRKVAPAFPKPEQIRNARMEVLVRDWHPIETNATAERLLLDDAVLAWSYFEWGAKNFDGMVPGTSWMEYGQQKGYPFTTMWDVGTYILATISAHRLKIIDQAKFETTINKILSFLKASNFHYAGFNLPHTERPLASQPSQREGFDSADAGRLLIALKILDVYSNDSFPVSQLIANWNFDSILADGEMHIVSDRGKLSSTHAGSYAGYASRGYRLWGYALKPVFSTENPDINMDQATLALAEIQRRGRISTEPHVTEEIELGASPHGKLMADVLYAAQIRRFKETGTLTCVSECPVAGIPYFTYQGYQIDDSGGKFVVDTQPQSSSIIDPKDRENLRMVSSKAAYLWYAARPGEYSQRLLSLVREQGRMAAMGFSSGIFEQTGKRTEVSDLNTNGIIIESIAYILGGRKPFLNPDATQLFN